MDKIDKASQFYLDFLEKNKKLELSSVTTFEGGIGVIEAIFRHFNHDDSINIKETLIQKGYTSRKIHRLVNKSFQTPQLYQNPKEFMNKNSVLELYRFIYKQNLRHRSNTKRVLNKLEKKLKNLVSIDAKLDAYIEKVALQNNLKDGLEKLGFIQPGSFKPDKVLKTSHNGRSLTITSIENALILFLYFKTPFLEYFIPGIHPLNIYDFSNMGKKALEYSRKYGKEKAKEILKEEFPGLIKIGLFVDIIITAYLFSMSALSLYYLYGMSEDFEFFYFFYMAENNNSCSENMQVSVKASIASYELRGKEIDITIPEGAENIKEIIDRVYSTPCRFMDQRDEKDKKLSYEGKSVQVLRAEQVAIWKKAYEDYGLDIYSQNKEGISYYNRFRENLEKRPGEDFLFDF